MTEKANRKGRVHLTYYLAIDIGASSGRHILAHIENGALQLEEVHRFENGFHSENGTLCWDTDHLLREVKAGIAKCGARGTVPKTVAIDTWGVDYVLLDKDRQPILPAVAYRDGRTAAVQNDAAALIAPDELYRRTGIQHQDFNTLFQLLCDKQSGKLNGAAHFLMMPDYLAFRLTGVLKNEYTNASTTNLLDAAAMTWDSDLLQTLDLPQALFCPLSQPGTAVGSFTDDVREEIGFDATVLLAPSHDTASAVAACPLRDDSAYLSSGTWSLIGTESLRPILTDEAHRANFTNEGGVEGRFRFLKNFMGMWLFQNLRRELNAAGAGLSYDDMMRMAMADGYDKTFDCNDPSLTAPDSMAGAIRALLGEDVSDSALLSSVYHSLASAYRRAVDEIETLTGKRIGSILIVGGGSKDRWLNELTARVTGRTVLTGLTEATALGNILSQIMADQKISLTEARTLVKQSFNIKETTV
ncbi:MAG: rhamnulokinase [Clostridia bacterium]|nr:rhamnulokinase [Clostridia bacterium]